MYSYDAEYKPEGNNMYYADKQRIQLQSIIHHQGDMFDRNVLLIEQMTREKMYRQLEEAIDRDGLSLYKLTIETMLEDKPYYRFEAITGLNTGSATISHEPVKTICMRAEVFKKRPSPAVEFNFEISSSSKNNEDFSEKLKDLEE